jgi:hypothetical protein
MSPVKTTRLDQALAIRDGLLKRCPDWYRGAAEVRMTVPGFECVLHRHPDGVHSTLQIWPDHGERFGDNKVLDNKVLNLWWDSYGRGELVSLRKPKAWMDILLATLDPEGAARRSLRLVK